jgi:ribosomal protein S6
MNTKETLQGDERLQVYEVGYQIVPIVSADTLPAEVNAIRSLIASNGGVLISEEMPKLRDLAYELSRPVAGKHERFETAYFGWMKFESSPSAIAAIQDGIEKNSNVLRYLLIKTVRENTLFTKPLAREDGESNEAAPADESKEVKEAKKDAEKVEKAKVEKKASKKTAASSADIDKSIDEMIAA